MLERLDIFLPMLGLGISIDQYSLQRGHNSPNEYIMFSFLFKMIYNAVKLHI